MMQSKIIKLPSMVTSLIRRLAAVRWTILLTAAMLFANTELLIGRLEGASPVAALLEYDRDAILGGELWRLATGNLVHWSAEHFWLDVGVFLLLGVIYEPSFKRYSFSFPAFLVAMAACIGAALLVLKPDLEIYRGLSGVDSGLFAAALVIEGRRSKGPLNRWFFLAPAALIFIVKLAYECSTGELFFGTSSLGDLGLPVPLAHAAGAVAALLAMGCTAVLDAARACRVGPASGAIAGPPALGVRVRHQAPRFLTPDA